jgi:hypothetical protein
MSDTPWTLGLRRDERVGLRDALYALRHAPEWRNVLGYDGQHVIALRPPPWCSSTHWTPIPWTEDDEARAMAWMIDHGVMATRGVVAAAILAMAQQLNHPPGEANANAGSERRRAVGSYPK